MRLHTAIYGSAVLIDRLLGFFLLPLLTRAISPGDYGAWTQTAIAAGMLVPLVLFALPTAVVRYFSGEALAGLRRRYWLRLAWLPLTLFALCCLFVSGLAGPVAGLVFGDAGQSVLVSALLTLLAAESLNEYAIAWLRAASRIGWVSAVLVLRSLMRNAAVLLLVSGSAVPLHGWLGQYAALQLGLALLVLGASWLLLRGAPSGTAPGDVPGFQTLLKFASPLVLLAFFSSMNAFLDRFLLVQLLGLQVVAVYSAAVSLCGIPSAFYSVLGFTLFPVLSRHWQAREMGAVGELMSQSVHIFLFCCLPVSMLLALSGPWLLPLLTTQVYQAGTGVYALLGLAVVSFGLYQIVLYALLLDGRSLQVLLLAVLATAVNLGFNLLLAPRFGLLGAAAAAAGSNLLMALLAVRLSSAVLAWHFPWKRSYTILAQSALASVPVLWLGGPAVSSLLQAIPLLASGMALYFAIDFARAGSFTRSLMPK